MDYKVLDEALAYLNNESYSDKCIYESLQDEFNLDLLLAVEEENLLSEMSGLILESESIEALNEGVRETILNYVAKIVQGVQKAWNKFSNLFTQAELNHLKTKVKPAIDKADKIEFIIKNYKSYDWDKLQGLKLVPFDYNRMQDQLKSSNDFYRANYAGLDIDGTRNIKEAAEKYLNKKIENVTCDKTLMQNIYNFAAVDYFKYRDEIEQDIQNLNNSNENIKNMVNEVISSETPQESFNYSDILSTDTILEAAKDNNNTNGDPKQTYEDKAGEKTSDGTPEAKENNEKRKAITKAVTIYMTASTKLLSAKMSIINKGKRESFMTLNHFYRSTNINKTAVDGTDKKAADQPIEKIKTDNIKKK